MSNFLPRNNVGLPERRVTPHDDIEGGGLSAVLVNGEPCPVWELEAKHGMTLAQYRERKRQQELRTFCTIGEVVMTLDEFEAAHSEIILGQE